MKSYKFVTVEIEQDEDAQNPRDEFDNLSTFYAVRNPRYVTGGKDDVEFRESWELSAHIKEFKREGAVVESFRSDAGECFAVVERSAIIAEYKGYTLRSALCRARQCAKAEIQAWLDWCNGEVYGYTIKDSDTGETLDSCWGFYGREYCEEEAESAANYWEKELSEKQAQIGARLEYATR